MDATAISMKLNRQHTLLYFSWNKNGKRYSDWNSLVEKSNEEGLCGVKGWRVPKVKELSSLVYCSSSVWRHFSGCGNYGEGESNKPTIAKFYFPNTYSSQFLSASPSNDKWYYWGIDFWFGGMVEGVTRDKAVYIRLVNSL